jgi:hypothetical protein
VLLPKHQSIVIGAMNKLYEKIQNVKIKDLIVEADIRKNVANKIVFQTREPGGLIFN